MNPESLSRHREFELKTADVATSLRYKNDIESELQQYWEIAFSTEYFRVDPRVKVNGVATLSKPVQAKNGAVILHPTRMVTSGGITLYF